MNIKVGYIIASGLSLQLPKGDAVHVRSFLEIFFDIGGKVFFIRKKVKSEKNNNFKIYTIRWLYIPKFWELDSLLFNFRLYQAGSSIIIKEKPDIIHERETFLNVAGLLLAKKYKIPYILEVNAPIMYAVGRHCSRIYQEIGKSIEKRLFNTADRIIVVSNALKDSLINQGLPGEKIRVVPNGADGKMFNPNVSGESVRREYHLEDKEVICFAGCLNEECQGIDDLLKAAKIISSIKPSVRFLIIGGTETEVKTLKKMAPDNVIVTGRIEHKKVPNYLAAADILIAPYKQQTDLEYLNFFGSAVKLFEYMAMGKPIITSNIGQVGEVLEHGKTGLLNEPGNYKELAQNILTLMEDEQLKKKLGENARIEFEKNYTWEQNARKIMGIYKEVLDTFGDAK